MNIQDIVVMDNDAEQYDYWPQLECVWFPGVICPVLDHTYERVINNPTKDWYIKLYGDPAKHEP